MRKSAKWQTSFTSYNKPFQARALGKTIRQMCDATNEIKTEIEQSIHQTTDIDTKFIADTQKEIGKLKNDLTKWNPS